MSSVFRMIPNVLTFLRCLLALPIAYAITHDRFAWALLALGIAVLTDAFDGYLARRWHAESRWGAVADPLADKLLLNTAFVCLASKMMLPWWLLKLIVLRDALIVLGGTLYQYFVEPVRIAPTRLSKYNTFFQMVFVLLLLIEQFIPVSLERMIYGMMLLVSVTTFLSLLDYVGNWGRKAYLFWRSRHVA